MHRSPFTRRFQRRGLAAIVGLAMAGNVQAADLWTIAQDALANDAELASTRSGFQATEAARDVQRGTLLPQIGIGGSVSHTRTYSSPAQGAAGRVQEGAEELGAGAPAFDQDDTVNSVGISLDAEQALYDPTRRAQLQRAEREIDRDALGLEATQQQLLFNVANAYFEILRAHDILSARRARKPPSVASSSRRGSASKSA